MYIVVFAPAFTLSLCESEAPASSIAIGTQVRIVRSLWVMIKKQPKYKQI